MPTLSKASSLNCLRKTSKVLRKSLTSTAGESFHDQENTALSDMEAISHMVIEHLKCQ